MSLGPPEVHPEQDLGPVGRLGAARSGADREDGPALVVFAREEELRALPGEVALESLGAGRELCLEIGVGRLLEQLEEGQQLGGTGLQRTPQVDLATQAVSLP
jgi:hypothetical protein